MEKNGIVNGATNSKQSNRLIGWLISYALDKRGKAFELRSGRYLLSKKGLDATRTIALDLADLSSPHLALHASTKKSLLVQDIFSEGGTYLRRSGASEETRIAGPVKLEHGDWIRVGNNTKFQVCLVDGSL